MPGKPVHQPQTKEKESNINTKLIALGVGVIVLILALAGLVLGAGLAKADTRGDMNAYAYLSEINSSGMSGSVFSARNLASTVCEKRAEGITESEAISYMEAPPPPIATHHQEVAMVLGAEWHFCPSYYVGGDSA